MDLIFTRTCTSCGRTDVPLIDPPQDTGKAARYHSDPPFPGADHRIHAPHRAPCGVACLVSSGVKAPGEEAEKIRQEVAAGRYHYKMVIEPVKCPVCEAK